MDKLQNSMQTFFRGSVDRVRAVSKDRKRAVSKDRKRAPHPVPEGMEGQPCPITGLFADAAEKEMHGPAVSALAELQADPDIAEERRVYMEETSQSRKPLVRVEQPSEPIGHFIVLNVSNGAHKASRDTKLLLHSIGGLPKLRQFTTIFYEKAFVDPHLDKFLRKHSDPHGERFATWIAEKFGEGTPWTEERKTRPRDVMSFGSHGQEVVAFDRSSAHFAAWHSPKREAHKWGQHFKPDDARVWMRVHFWAAREAGLFDPQYAAFMDYYIRFIGHFVSIYSGKSPAFTRDSARWSANPRNIEQYKAAGNFMSDVIDKPVEEELAKLPGNESIYTGSRAQRPDWPYGGPR